MSDALRFEGVVKCYGRRRALDGLTLQAPAGAFAGIVGSNGAGKTTFLSAAAGLLRVSAGTIEVLGEGPFDPARHAGRVALLPQDAELPRDAAPRDLLVFYGELQGLDRRTARRQADEALERFHLTDRSHSPLRTLSHGLRKRVAIAQCFLGDPELILLDEPMSGLDPREMAAARDFLAAQRRKRTIVLSSHNLHEIETLCDHVIFIERGRVTRAGALDAVTDRDGRIEYTLGPGAEPDAAALGGGDFECAWNSRARTLTCRYSAARFDAAEVNRRLLPRLLEAGCAILEIRRGERLEKRYLEAENPQRENDARI